MSKKERLEKYLAGLKDHEKNLENDILELKEVLHYTKQEIEDVENQIKED